MKEFRRDIKKTQNILKTFLSAQEEEYFSEAVMDENNDDQDYRDFAIIVLTNFKDNSFRNKVENLFKKIDLI